jgi:hypothetical protein
MRIVQRQSEDEMPKCEVIFERALSPGAPFHWIQWLVVEKS